MTDEKVDAATARPSARRRVLIVAAGSLMLVAVVICVAVGISSSHHRNAVLKTSVKKSGASGSDYFALSACRGAADPQLCVSTIAGFGAWPQSAPTKLVNIAVKASIGLVEKTWGAALNLSGMAAFGLERAALEDCIELLEDTSDQLTEALSYAISLDMTSATFEGSDIRTFLSAGLTNQDTCIEGLAHTKGIVKSKLQRNVQEISQLVSTSLAMAKRLSHLGDARDEFGPMSPPHNRRLLSDQDRDGFPAWLSAADRRLLQVAPTEIQVDAWVDMHGTGNYTTITAAIKAAPEKNPRRYVIHVRAGVYHEKVEIKKKKINLMFIGDGMDSTIVTGSISVLKNNVTTFRSATFAVKGMGFIARDMGFENTAGPQNHQAVALRVGSDQSVFYRCSMKGYQDTLYAHSLRQFYRECKIYGTVDFIFGNAAAVFQSCVMMPRKPIDSQIITVTAQGRKDPNQNTGFSIHDCNITAGPDFAPVKNLVPTYLGRPWKQFSRTVVMQSFLDDIIHPAGWVQWNASDFALNTCYYGEYMNYGAGAGVANRINWAGYHSLNISQANKFTVAKFIQGNVWLPSTGVTYMSGLKV